MSDDDGFAILPPTSERRETGVVRDTSPGLPQRTGGDSLLPPLTAVQRAWVSAVAAMMPSEHRRQLHAWAERRWGAPRWATLGRIATAVWQFRIEGGVMPDNDRGRTHSASCATCRSWDGFGDGWGECVRPDERWNAEMADLVPPTLIRVVLEGEARVCDEHCLARLHTESRFGCRAWEPRSDSGPQDAPESSQGPDYRDGGFRRVAGRLR